MPVVNADTIPDELKDRDQWLLWDADNETPRRPHWRGNFGVNWSNPDDWHTFEDAYSASQERDSWGIGYVTARDNDDYPRGLIGVIDIDRGLREKFEEKPKKWVPSLQKFVDDGAYIEYSPSGTGLHIPFIGEVPEWWRDCQIDDHEGVDVLTNKFCTFTGNKTETSGSEVTETDITPFLYDAYTEIKGENPRKDTSENDGSDGDSDWTQEQVEEALSHVDETLHYSDWLRVGMAIYDWDDGSTGKRIFENWSKSNSKWNEKDGQPHIDDIWDNDSPNGSITLGTLTYYAEEGGWTPPWEKSAQSDGGTQVARSPNNGPSLPNPLTPRAVKEQLGVEDPDETKLQEIPNNEIAFAVSRILESNEDWHFCAVDDDTEDIYSCSDGVWHRNGEERLKTALHYAAHSANSKRLHSELCHQVRSNPLHKVGREELGAPNGTIAVANGLLDLREQSDRPLTPEDYALNRLSVEFDPGADYDGTEWQEFLDDAVRDGDQPKLQEYAGYLLWHHAQPFGKALFLVGPTDSGKGTFLDVIESIIGEENIASQSLYNLMQSRFGMAEIYGKMANIRNEVTGGGLKNVERFKELTGGGDRVSAERKGQNPFKFQVTQKFVFATNQVPKIEHAGEPFFNRLLFVKFPDTVPPHEQDRDLGDRLKDEAPAILNWMLDGLNRLLENNGFTDERDIGGKREIADAFGNVLERFAHNLLEITGDPNDKVHKGQLHDLYAEYADYIGKSADPQGQFTKGLKGMTGVDDGESRKVDDPDDSKPRVFTGVRVIGEHVEEIGADLPNHSYANEGGSGGQQTF